MILRSFCFRLCFQKTINIKKLVCEEQYKINTQYYDENTFLDFCLSVKINNSLKKIIITPKNRKESHKTLSEMFDPNTSQTEK